MLKKFLKQVALGLTLACVVGLVAGCGGDKKDTKTAAKSYKIGIVQLVEHGSLDAANKGFVDGLKKRGYEEGKNLTIDRQNAQADQSNLQNIGHRFINNKVDLIYAIATPAAQTVANMTKDIPIVGSAITDYESAKLVASNKEPKGNVTGTTDMNPIKEQLDLILKIMPNVKTIGIIYCSSEVNSEVQVKIFRDYAATKNIKIETATISTVNDIQQAAQSLVNKVDVFYEPTDNIMASAMPTLASVTDPAKKVVVAGAADMVADGGVFTYAISYYDLGVQSGDMAADILEGKGKPATMAIQPAKNLQVVVNKERADMLGVKIPEDIMKTATIVGGKTKKK